MKHTLLLSALALVGATSAFASPSDAAAFAIRAANERAATQTVAKRISPADAAANLEVVEQMQRLLGSNVQEALALEVGFLKLKL